MPKVNYEVRLKTSARYEKEEIEASLRNIFGVFDEFPISLIPKTDKVRIMRYINDIMDETDTTELEKDLRIINESVAEIVIFEEDEKKVELPAAELGAFYLYHVDKADGEEEHIDEDAGTVTFITFSKKKTG